MKKTIKDWLKRFPFIFLFLRKIYRFLRKIYRAFIPERSKVQKQILRNLKKKSVFFVQVGSNDGVTGDPLHDLIMANQKWKGIFIEPVSFLFDRLTHNYGNSSRFIFENKAISPNADILEFFYVSEKAKCKLGDSTPVWYDQVGSFDRNHILHLFNIIDIVIEPYVVSEQIEAVPLQDIFKKHKVIEIDLLHIDAEGHDYKVLSTLDFSKYKPSIILYEHMHLSDVENKLAESLLAKNGYTYARYNGDTLAIVKG